MLVPSKTPIADKTSHNTAFVVHLHEYRPNGHPTSTFLQLVIAYSIDRRTAAVRHPDILIKPFNPSGVAFVAGLI